ARDTRLVPVPAELTTYDVLLVEWKDRFQDARFLVANGLCVLTNGFVHGEYRGHLQEMVLDDVADRSRLLVEASAALHPEMLSHCDVHARHVVAIPERLEKRVRKAEVKEVLHRFLAEEVIDSIDRRFREGLVQRLVEGLRRREIAAERFL